MVTIQVLGAILEFTVLSLMQVFNDDDSRRFGVFEMPLHVFDEYGWTLCPKTKLFRGFLPRFIQHGVARRLGVEIVILRVEEVAPLGMYFIGRRIHTARRLASCMEALAKSVDAA